MQRIFAHRGASGYAPENTLEAFALAINQGAHGIELDVHMAADGELVVAHDEKIDRVSNGSGYIRRMTTAELKRFVFSKQHPAYQTATIPTLREVFALIQPTYLEINVEIKHAGTGYPGIEQKCSDLAAEMGMTERILYSSFNHDSMVRMKRICPAARCGVLYEKMPNAWEYARKLGMDALHPQWESLRDKDLCKHAHALGLMVNVWTVNTEADIRFTLDHEADIVITNYPDRALTALQGK